MNDPTVLNFRVVVGGDGPGVNVYELYSMDNVAKEMRYRRNGDIEVKVTPENLGLVGALAYHIIKQQKMIDELERRWEDACMSALDE